MGAIKQMAEEMGYFEMSTEEQEKFSKDFEMGKLKDIPEKYLNKEE